MRKILVTAAAAATMLGAPALAQETATATDTTMTADPATTTDTAITADPTAMPVEEDDNDFPWGLLGLLGLAGLFGRNKRDTHVHQDTTRSDV